jgi:hypothetical protein
MSATLMASLTSVFRIESGIAASGALWESLNKSPRTSCRHIFPLTALKNLEIHKVFLRFFALSEKKSDVNLRTLI